jgi:ribose transport system permease protein
MHFIARMLQIREIGVLLALVILVMAMSLLSDAFLTELNIFNVLRGMSTIGIMSIGMTMVIVTAGIDLSIGSILAASSVITARLMFTEVTDPWTAVLLGLMFGGGLGMANGLIITKLKVNPFITTLGMMTIARGLTYLLASGLQGTVASNVPMRDPAVSFLGGGYVLQDTFLQRGIPFPVILMFILVIVFSLFLRNTVLGRQVYAVGSNEAAARLSGVPADRVKIFVYTLTGILCALAGIMTAGLLRTAATNAGVGIELDVIAAVVIGGASLAGGEGTIFGAIIGAAIMAVVRNAFVLLQFPSYAQQITIGVVIVAAVAIDRWRRRNR